MRKVLLFILPALLLTGCKVKDKEMEITVFGESVSSVYTGKVKRKLPHGEGTAMIGDALAEGIFEEGIWISGTAESIPYILTYGDHIYEGIYTGDVSGQMPDGTGVFASDDFSYDGVWVSGMPEEGTVSAEYFRIDTPDGILEGNYSGAVSNCQAEGNGTFTYRDGEQEIRMEGTFSGNRFDSTMTRTITYQDTVKTYPVFYENGQPRHTAAAMIAYLEGMRRESYCLNEDQISFIDEHSAVFEGRSDKLPENAGTVTYDTFSEDSKPSLVLIRNAVIRSVQRYKPYSGAGTVTSLIVQENNSWYHIFFAYPVETADPGDIVNICALPLCRSTITAPEQDYPAIDAAGAVMTGY